MLDTAILHLLRADCFAASVGQVKGNAVDERARVDLACVRGLAAGYDRELEVGASRTVL